MTFQRRCDVQKVYDVLKGDLSSEDATKATR